jgi:hypothetical protein
VSIRVGTEVTWSWGSGQGRGTVREVHREKVTRTITGEEVTRNGSAENPAYLIETEDSQVLKLRSEVERAD